MKYIGIDISKATFVAAFPVERGYRTETFQNDIKGIRRFISKLSSDTHHCVMEATGNYCFLLLYLLDKVGIRASLVKELKIKNYARVMLSVTKTDAKDACLMHALLQISANVSSRNHTSSRPNRLCCLSRRKQSYVNFKSS